MIRNIHTIVGAGPVGLLLGCLLAKQGIPSQILEKSERRSQLTRALMIHAASLDIFSTIDVDREVMARGLRQRYIHFDVDHEARFSLDFACLSPAGFPGFVNLRQPVLERVLEERFTSLGGQMLRRYELIDLAQHANDVTLTVDTPNGRRVACVPFLIGCDGANSTVRGLLRTAFAGHDYTYRYLLAEGTPSQCSISTDASYMAINAQSALSIVPMDNGEYRIAGPGSRTDVSDAPLTRESIEQLIRDTGLAGVPALSSYSAIRHYAVRERCAERFASGRVFLCGDSAHVHSPAGGQAMNLGFGDAFSLAWRLAGNAGIEAMGERWQAERMRLARAVIARTQIGPLLAKMRGRTVSDTELTSLAETYSQLFHDVCEQDDPLRQKTLRPGVRLPNLPLPDGRSVWRALEGQGKIELSASTPAGHALASHFACQAVDMHFRPDFHVEHVEASVRV
jgi:2-polyprenyl-6-methoxyphenol hydroxylase-like FAD-dependent oxidoreductase